MCFIPYCDRSDMSWDEEPDTAFGILPARPLSDYDADAEGLKHAVAPMLRVAVVRLP